MACWFYPAGLRAVPASVAAVSFDLIPVFGVGAALLFGERLGPAQWAGAAVVVVAAAAMTARRASSPSEAIVPAAAEEAAVSR